MHKCFHPDASPDPKNTTHDCDCDQNGGASHFYPRAHTAADAFPNRDKD